MGHLSPDEKAQILRALQEGYDVKNGYVTKDGKDYLDPYTNKKVTLANMAILPGSWIVIDYNPASIIAYQIHHPE